MAKPTDVLRWCDNPTTARTAPPAGLKDVGAVVTAKWPSQYLNYLHGLAGDWITWINTRIFDLFLQPTVGSDCYLHGDPDEGLAVTDDTAAGAGDRLPVRMSEAWLGAAGAVRVKEASGEVRFTDSATPDALVPTHGSTIYGTEFRLDADYDSFIAIPLGCGHPTELGGVGTSWKSLAGTAPDMWISTAASGSLTFEAQIPQGAKLVAVAVDWQPHAASPTSPMKFSAQKHTSIPGGNGEGVGGDTFAELLSTTYINQAASALRKWATMTCDQNNTQFTCYGAVDRVRVRIEASDEAGADMVYGVYLIVTHRSVGHLSPAPNVA